MTARTVKRLSDLEIDEVSLVDRPANQHGLVAIAKRAEAPVMALVDEEGFEVTVEELEPGEYARDADTGELFYMASPEELAELEAEGVDFDVYEAEFDEDAEDLVPELVGKARGKGNVPGLERSTRKGKSLGGVEGTRGNHGGGFSVGRKGSVGKSLGQSVLEELSKALNDGDRDTVVSKLAERVEEFEQRAIRAERVAKALADEREDEDYARLAETYDIPVDPRQFGGILRRVSKVLNDDELSVLDRVFSASGVGFDELGVTGSGVDDVMGRVSAIAVDAVSKNQGVSEAQAVSALFSANPDAYDEYLSENR